MHPATPVAAPASETAQRPRLTWPVRVACGAVVLVVAALCTFLLELSLRAEGTPVRETALDLDLVGTALIVVLILFVWSVIGRLWWALGIVAGMALLAAGGNGSKVDLRREPFYPSDLDFVSQIGFLVGSVDTATAVSAAVAVVVLVAVVLAAGWIAGRRFPRTRIRRPGGGVNGRYLALRLGTLVVTGVLLLQAVTFNSPHNLWRALYEKQGAEWTASDQLYNYRANGFLGGFLYNMPTDPMPEPDGYSDEAMAEIAERYGQRAQEINADRDGSLDDVNVVMVLSESFTDPSWMDGFELEENPVPNTQELMTQTPSGPMYANSFGGGTATMEFESLTGQPMGLFNPQVSSPYQAFVGDRETYPSAVGAFAETGHRTVAIHPYTLDMYKRPQAYAALGFDEVIDRDGMQSQQRVERNPYISDRAAFGEVLHQIDDEQDSLFVNLVTMQNHGPYIGFYDDPIRSDIPEEGDEEQVGQYARGLSYTDAELPRFLDELRSRDEETIVVFYGDHLPGVYNTRMLAENDPDAQVRTPYFVWSSETNTAREPAAATPAMFLPMIYEAADAPVPPFVALLDDMRSTAPVLQHGRVLDPQGEELEGEDLEGRDQALLDDLGMVQYDFSTGQGYALEEMWPQADDG